MTQAEGSRWIQAAVTDLNAAQSLFVDGYYHLCAFHAQQAAEKALKGLLRLLGQIPWGYSCFDLLTEIDGLLSKSAIPLYDQARFEQWKSKLEEWKSMGLRREEISWSVPQALRQQMR